MPRRGHIAHRDVLPDPMYGSKVVTKLINSIMLDGKKGVAQKIVYGAFDIIREKTEKDPLEVFEQCMENIMPVLEVKAKRIGGASRAPSDAGSALVDELLARPFGAHDEGASCKRNPRRAARKRRRGEEARRHPQDGRGQPCVCPLPLGRVS